MRFAGWARLLVMITFGSLAVGYSIQPAVGEFSIGGEGKFKDSTREASAIFHKALASFHSMMGALDSGDLEAAITSRGQTVEELHRAAKAYASSGEYASDRRLNPIADSAQQKLYVDYFLSHRENYGVQLPLTERELTGATSRIIENLASGISKADLRLLRDQLSSRQNFLQIVLDIESFLNSASTYLQVG